MTPSRPLAPRSSAKALLTSAESGLMGGGTLSVLWRGLLSIADSPIKPLPTNVTRHARFTCSAQTTRSVRAPTTPGCRALAARHRAWKTQLPVGRQREGRQARGHALHVACDLCAQWRGAVGVPHRRLHEARRWVEVGRLGRPVATELAGSPRRHGGSVAGAHTTATGALHRSLTARRSERRRVGPQRRRLSTTILVRSRLWRDLVDADTLDA